MAKLTAKTTAKTKVRTSSSGRRFVDIDDVIRRRLAEIKKNGNGNGRGLAGKVVGGEVIASKKAMASGKDSNP